jgi:hypothetical protein
MERFSGRWRVLDATGSVVLFDSPSVMMAIMQLANADVPSAQPTKKDEEGEG